MSGIAEFYLVDDAGLAALLAAASAEGRALQKRGWLSRKPAPGSAPTTWEVLAREGRRLRHFAFSGYAFNPLTLMLEQHSVFIESVQLADAAARLSKAIGRSVICVSAEEAANLSTALAGIRLDTPAIQAFLVAEYGGDIGPSEVNAVASADSQLREWLASVPPGAFGVLAIG